MTPLAHQIYSFILSAIGGMMLGAGFDLYRTVVRVAYRRWWVSITDFTMWLLGAGVFFLVLLWGNLGEVRAYIFVGLAIGLLVYFRYASEEVRAFWEGMLELVSHLVRTAIHLALWPFVFFYQSILRAAAYLVVIAQKSRRWAMQRLVFPLQRMLKPIVNGLHEGLRRMCNRFRNALRRPPQDPPT